MSEVFEHRLAREIKSSIIDALERRLRVDSLSLAAQATLAEPETFIALVLEIVVRIVEEEVREVLEKHELMG